MRFPYKSAVVYISLCVDNPDGANSIGNSRDCLLSTDTSSDTWTFHGMLRDAASYVWHRMSNGTNTSCKSKSE
jgi:hypothetical protein